MATSPQFVATAKLALVKLVNATGTTLTTLLTVGSNGGIIQSLFITSDDTTSRKITISLGNGTTDVKLGTFTIPISTASTPVQVVNCLDTTLWPWIDYTNIPFPLAAGTVIKVQMDGAVTSAKETSVVALYGEF